MDQEINITNQKKKDEEEELTNLTKKYELIKKEKKELELQLENQKHETIIAQSALNNMNRELNAINWTKQKFEKQWEESLSAMSKRDATLQEVHNKYIETKEKFDVCQKKLNVYQHEKDYYENVAIIKINGKKSNIILIIINVQCQNYILYINVIL